MRSSVPACSLPAAAEILVRSRGGSHPTLTVVYGQPFTRGSDSNVSTFLVIVLSQRILSNISRIRSFSFVVYCRRCFEPRRCSPCSAFSFASRSRSLRTASAFRAASRSACAARPTAKSASMSASVRPSKVNTTDSIPSAPTAKLTSTC
eukprot:6432965-Prymnesium_polylepis.1